jgi:hypothetical protein
MMPIELKNAPIVFQHLMNNDFHKCLDDLMVCSINNILIFSKNMEDYEQHVCLVLDKLKEIKLYTKYEVNVNFMKPFEVEFLGYIIFGDGICMNFCS